MKRCSRCVLPDTVPGISFNENGVCNFCIHYENSFRDWEDIKDKKKKEFEKLIDSAKKLKRGYDCIIPLSGGKDSTFVLYLTTKVYGLHCLAVTFDNGFMSTRAKENIRSAIEVSNTDHFVYRMNKKNSLQLFQSFLKKTGGFCNACMRGVNFTIETAAKKFNVPLIIKGSGKRVQYISNIPGVTNSNSSYFFKRVIRGDENNHWFSILGSNRIGLEFYKLAYLLKIPRTFLMKFFPQSIGIYDFIYKPYTEIIDIIQKETGWKKPEDTFEHFDCLLHGIPFYKDTLKINGITPHTFHNSGLIRQGLMSRNDALKKEEGILNREHQKPDDLERFLSDLQVSYDEFSHFVKFSDPKNYIPRFERVAKRIYHWLYYKK